MSRVTETASNDNGDWIAVASQCVTAMLHQRGAGQDFATREKLALELGNEILRVVLTRELQAIADAEGPVVSGGGVEYRRHQRGTVTYHSLVGPLRVTRWTYRARGVRNGPTVVALDARAKLLSRATPALSYAIARGFACVPSRQLERDLLASARQPRSRSTLERMGTAFGAAASDELLLLEREVRARETLPREPWL